MFLINNKLKYLNNQKFRFSFIGGINIITHAIFMKIRIVHTLRDDWFKTSIDLYKLYELYRVSVLGIYMTPI